MSVPSVPAKKPVHASLNGLYLFVLCCLCLLSTGLLPGLGLGHSKGPRVLLGCLLVSLSFFLLQLGVSGLFFFQFGHKPGFSLSSVPLFGLPFYLACAGAGWRCVGVSTSR